MNTFEYVSVIFSVVVSLAFTHLLSGVVRLIHARGVKFSLAYAGWVLLLVFWCVDYWFSVWHARGIEIWTLPFVALLLLMATALYIACGLAMPNEVDAKDGIDLAAFHEANRRRFLGAVIAYELLMIFGNLAIASLESAALINVGQLVLTAAAWLWSDRRVQLGAVALIWLLTGWYAHNFIPTL